MNSGVLGRSHNLAQVLKFICEKHFEVRPARSPSTRSPLKHSDAETISIPGRHNRPSNRHQLRKRLQEIYAGPGASRSVQVHIPPGQYAPSFVHKEEEIAMLPPPALETQSKVLHPLRTPLLSRAPGAGSG